MPADEQKQQSEQRTAEDANECTFARFLGGNARCKWMFAPQPPAEVSQRVCPPGDCVDEVYPGQAVRQGANRDEESGWETGVNQSRQRNAEAIPTERFYAAMSNDFENNIGNNGDHEQNENQ